MADLLRDANPQYLATDLLEDKQHMNFEFQRLANELASKIQKYRRHRWFGYAHLTQRIGALTEVKGTLLRMRSNPNVNRAKWTELRDQVNSEFYFLDKLQRHRRQQDTQFGELINAMEQSIGQPAKKVTTIQGGKVHSSLRGGYIMERLDPLHRGRDPKLALGLFLEFKRWIAGNGDPLPRGLAQATPWDQLMAFFLHKHDEDPSKTDTKPTYHGKKERFFDSLEFDGMTLDVENRQTGRTTKKRVGKALSYYAFRPSEEGGAKYERYNYRTHGKTLFPYQAPFHTVSKQGRDWFGSVTYPENAQKARGFSENDVQLCWASLYVLVNGTFHLAHADDFHSWAAGGAGVAAAGLIAGDKGKVVAIDNASGHYAPNWRQLRQAVQLIANNGAFAPNGVVGLVYKYDLPSGEAFNSAVLRWMDFLRLCHVIQDRGRRMQTWDAITSQYPSLPAIADRASGTLAVHKRVWEKHNFTWEKVGEDLFDYVDSQ